MSHFSVLVFTKGKPSDEELSEILMPWHVFECTGCDNQYVKDIDITDETRKEYEKDTKTQYKDPQGVLHDPYLDRFYRDFTVEEKEDIKPLGGMGFAKGFSYTSRDWKDGQGYRSKIRFLPEGWEEVEIPTKDIQTFAEYVADWCEKPIVKSGHIVTEDCKYGYALVDDNNNVLKVIKRTNPEAKWDWWQVGGRYANKFSMKNPEDDPRNWKTCWLCHGTGMRNDDLGKKARLRNPDYTCNGCGGTGRELEWPTHWHTEGDEARIADIDFAAFKAKAIQQREDWVQEIMAKSNCSRDDVAIACELHRIAHTEWKELSEPKPRGEEYTKWIEEKGGNYLILANVKKKNWEIPKIPDGQTLEEWIQAAPAITTFAYVKDGQWHERGEMGWWGCVSNEKDGDSWDAEIANLFVNYEDDDWVTCIDCHI